MGNGSSFTWPTIDTELLYRAKTGWRQRPPYVPRAYSFDQVKRIAAKPGGLPPNPSSQNIAMCQQFADFNRAVQHATNRSYAAFVGAISDRAELATNAAEIGQSYEMIRSRCITLARFSRHVRRKQFRQAAASLGMAIVPPGVRMKKSFANNWLEFWFGWKPLVSDIYSAIGQIQQPIRSYRPRGHGFSTWHAEWRPQGAAQSWTHDRDIGVLTVANVAVANPNLWLANTMGLINPLSVAWELVPFSFVVDWFVNVGQVLGSFSDLAGLTVTDSSQTVFVRGKTRRWWQTYNWDWSYDHSCVMRSTGISTPVLTLAPWRAPSKTRAVTAIALLIQQLQ